MSNNVAMESSMDSVANGVGVYCAYGAGLDYEYTRQTSDDSSVVDSWYAILRYRIPRRKGVRMAAGGERRGLSGRIVSCPGLVSSGSAKQSRSRKRVEEWR
jgi:hypothetical protein